MRLPRLRFDDPLLERDFRREQRAIGKLAHATPWLFFAFATWAIAATDPLAFTPVQAHLVQSVRHFVVVPACLAAAAVALLPPKGFAAARVWASVLGVAISEASIGFGFALMAHDRVPLGDKPIMIASGVVTTLLVVSPALFSLRAVHHAVAGTLGSVLFVACLLRHPELDQRQLVYAVFSAVASFAMGSGAAVQVELVRRSEFEQRRRNQTLLEREVAHQVAARSRELGQALARLDRAERTGERRLSEGERFDERYRIVRALGEGGMGSVYEVERITDGRSFALKVIAGHSSPARFAREAEIGARVNHPNVVPIVDVGLTERGSPFLVMELVSGGSLEIHRRKFGDAAWARSILRDIANGLAALHEAGVVHRDLKPANVLLDDGERVRISDFGISSYGTPDADPEARTMQALTRTGALLGTPQYMAPEAAFGGSSLDARADVFSFGVVACELLTGRVPYEVPPVWVAIAGRELTEPDLTRIEPDLAATIRACLAQSPDARPALSTIVARLSASRARGG